MKYYCLSNVMLCTNMPPLGVLQSSSSKNSECSGKTLLQEVKLINRCAGSTLSSNGYTTHNTMYSSTVSQVTSQPMPTLKFRSCAFSTLNYCPAVSRTFSNVETSKIKTIALSEQDTLITPLSNGCLNSPRNEMTTLNMSSFENPSLPCKSNVVCDKESTKVSDFNDSVSTVQVLPTVYTVQNSASPIDSAKENNDTVSKVVVQVMPTLEFGNITALQQCISDSEIPQKRQHIVEQSKVEMNLTSIGDQINERNSLAIQNENKSRDGIRKQFVNGVCTEEKFSLSKYSLKRKMRRNHNLKFHVRPGRGIRLSSINYIVSEVNKASPVLLRILHYVLFGTYGMCNNEYVLSETKQNILHFSGFPYSEDSEIYQNKRKCLSRIPYPMLSGMSNILLGKGLRTRDDSVEDLLRFLNKPKIDLKVKQMVRTNHQEPFVGAGSQSNEKALKGLSPIVLLHRLNDSFVKELLLKMKPDTSKHFETVEGYIKPNYILPGRGSKLKSFPEVAVRVHRARRRIINLLHSLLYGKPGSNDANRLNILEFSGFHHVQENTFKRRNTFLSKLKSKELSQMCDLFSLRVKSGNKTKKIRKLLQYLQRPVLTATDRRRTKDLQPEKEIDSKRKESQDERKPEVLEQPVIRLKDFENIRYNIECASPEDLTELNDLLFLKPCDDSEIHQLLLEFTPFSNDENSSDFQIRRTLLHYMNFDIIRKIARILDITDWEKYTFPHDLAITTLKFLTDMKPPVRASRAAKPSVTRSRSKTLKSSSSQKRSHPHILMMKKVGATCNERSINGNFSSPFSEKLHSPYSSGKLQEKVLSEDAPNTSVIVHRISESSYSYTDLKNNEPLTISDGNSDESLSLYDFIHHPTEEQLESIIRKTICTNSWSTTMGDLINKVFHYYPKLNLTYRVDFIKSKALEVIHELQKNTLESCDISL